MKEIMLSEIWRSAFAKAGTGENCCRGCGHEVVFWEEGGVWRVRNMVLCEKTPGSCLVTELKIAANSQEIRIKEV
ncbi:MAG: hypothetical protein AAB775_00365 [Patescibacteria group bacterium]